MTPQITSPRGTHSAVILLTLGMVMSGTIGYFVVESGAPVAIVVFWRCVVGTTGLLIVMSLRSGTRRELVSSVTSRVGLIIAGSGALLVLNWILIFAAYDYLTIGVSTVIFHVEPFLLLALGAIFLRERFTRKTLAWSTLGFLGIILVARPWAAHGEKIQGLLIGVAFTLIAATLYAASIVVVRYVQARHHPTPSPLVIITIQLAAGAVITSPALAFQPHHITSSGWSHLLVLGLVNTALMYLVIYSAYPRLRTATIGVLAFIYPAAAVVVDLVAYGSPITAVQLVGFAAIAGAGIGQIITQEHHTAPPETSNSNTRRTNKSLH